MANKTDKSVVRNAQYRRGGLSVRQRHNERQNADYMNDDIIQDRAAYNVHFKQAQGSYESVFDKMEADKIISTRGLGKDPFIVDELVFDVNTAYFENGGGYEYAKSFFEEAYRCAVEEIGGEQYVLSAVMHADERNKALSEQLGRDIFHYHLHVVYVPVVDKEIYFKKNNKDPEKAGKLREVIKQVSHSKKWPKHKQLDDNGEIVRNAKGKPVLLNSYSLLQDHFFEHMKEAGFAGFERGERGSTAEHLSVLEFKAKMEAERVAAMTAVAEEKQNEVNYLSVVSMEKQEEADRLDTDIAEKSKKSANLDNSVKTKQDKLNDLTAKLTVEEKVAVEYEEIEKLGHKRGVLGGITVSGKWWETILNLVKEAFASRKTIKKLNAEIKELKADVKRVTTALEKQKSAYTKLLNHVQPYLDAVKMFPSQVKETISQYLDIGHKQREQARLEQLQREQAQRQSAPVPQQTTRKRNDLDR